MEYKEKTPKTNEEADYQKYINTILVIKIKDTEKLNETLEPIIWPKQTLKKSTRKYSKREETVIDNKSSTLNKEQYKVQSRGIKIIQQSMQRLKLKKI